MFPDVLGNTIGLTEGTGNMLDKHGMSQAFDCIEAQKDEDIGIITSRLQPEKIRICEIFCLLFALLSACNDMKKLEPEKNFAGRNLFWPGLFRLRIVNP